MGKKSHQELTDHQIAHRLFCLVVGRERAGKPEIDPTDTQLVQDHAELDHVHSLMNQRAVAQLRTAVSGLSTSLRITLFHLGTGRYPADVRRVALKWANQLYQDQQP